MANDIKGNGAYDKRKIAGRMSEGKTLAPKATKKKVEKGLKNTKKAGK